MDAETRERLFAAALGGKEKPASEVVDACAVLLGLRGMTARQVKKIADEVKILQALEQHLRYAIKAETRLAAHRQFRGLNLPVVALQERHGEIVAALESLRPSGGRPRKPEPALFAMAIDGILARHGLKPKDARRVTERCLLALGFTPPECESAIKKLPKLRRSAQRKDGINPP
jgi:hypothetical protein